MGMEKIYLVELSTGSYAEKNTRIIKAFKYALDAIQYVERARQLICKINAHNDAMADVISYTNWDSCFHQCSYNIINDVTVFEMPLT